jgi:hypothetical protein
MRFVIESSMVAIPRARSMCLISAVLWLGSCADRSSAKLEVWEDGAYRPRVIRAYEISGRRDGAATSAVAVLTLESGDRLRAELRIAYNPTPVLDSGRWRLDGSPCGEGEVRAEAIKFLGGQGQSPSLGGRFRLNEDGMPRFLVTLPARPVAGAEWSSP